jgi:general secretion pathway protein L
VIVDFSSADKWTLFGVDVLKILRAWWGELSASVPARVKQLFVRQPARVVIACRAEQCVLLADEDERSNEIAVLDRRALDEHAAGFLAPQLDDIERRGGAGLVIDMLLEPSALLRHRLELPIQLESSLRQSIAYQLNRLTPFSEADLYYDVVVRERDAANRRLQVELVAAPRSRVEPLLREMTRLCGREIDRLTTADLGPAANLLGGSRTRFRPNRNFWLLLALLGCLGVLAVTPLLAKRSAMLEQKAAIRELQQSVGELAREKNTLEADGRSLAYIVERRKQSPRMTTLVEELSYLVPKSIYLTQLAVAKGRVRLTGQGADVVGLIDLLNASYFLDEAKFESTVSRNPRTGLDQFSVGAKLVGPKQDASEQDASEQDASEKDASEKDASEQAGSKPAGLKQVGSKQVGAQEQ